MVTRKDAEKALEAINGTTIVGENKNEEQGRVAAVDWALSKDKWKEAEGKAEAAAPAEEKAETTEGEKDAEGDVNMEEKPEGIEIGESGEMMVPAEEEEEEKEEEAVKPALPAPEEGSTLFIRNLSFEATEDQLRLLYVSPLLAFGVS
jgi:nucleolar protein 4